jgi:hypothetical protein
MPGYRLTKYCKTGNLILCGYIQSNIEDAREDRQLRSAFLPVLTNKAAKGSYKRTPPISFQHKQKATYYSQEHEG